MDKLTPYFHRFEDPTFLGVTQLSYVIIGTMIAGLLPPQIAAVLDNCVVRMASLALVAYALSKNARTALGVAIAVMAVHWILAQKAHQNKVDNFTGYGKSELFGDNDTGILITPPIVNAGCLAVTKADLIAAFDRDEDKLKQAMFDARIPVDVELDDSHAPLIASILVNYRPDLLKNSKQGLWCKQPDVFL